MPPLAQEMEAVFIIAWCIGVGAHIYATRYYLPMWRVGFKKREEHEGYGCKHLSATEYPRWPSASASPLRRLQRIEARVGDRHFAAVSRIDDR